MFPTSSAPAKLSISQRGRGCADLSAALTIRGEKKREDEEKGKDFYRKERSFGAFRRSLPIPADVDEGKIDASFAKGVLYIELPKTEEARKKISHIDVKAA